MTIYAIFLHLLFVFLMVFFVHILTKYSLDELLIDYCHATDDFTLMQPRLWSL